MIAEQRFNTRSTIFGGVGKTFSADEHLSVAEAMELAHADYEVKKQPIIACPPSLIEKLNNNEVIDADLLRSLMLNDWCATMRHDNEKTLGIMTNKYGIVQNADAFQFVDLLCGEHNTSITNVGVIAEGAKTFITAKINEQWNVGSKDDKADVYVVVYNSHDGSGAVRVCITPIRVFCTNCLALAFKNASASLSFRHTEGLSDRMQILARDKERVNTIMANLNSYKETFEGRMENLKHVVLNDLQIKDIVAKVVLSEDNYKIYKSSGINSADLSTRSRNLFNGMLETFHSGVGQDNLEPNTGLWLINGVTTYYQNAKNWGDAEKKFDSITSGQANNHLQLVHNLLAQVA